MEAQLYNAVVIGTTAIVAALVTFIVALLRWIPKRVDAQLEEYKANEATKREVILENSDAERERKHAESEKLLAEAQLFRTIINEFQETRSTTEAHTIAVANNTASVENNGKQINGLKESVGQLKEKIEETDKRIVEAVAKIPTNAAQLESSITTVSDMARTITVAQVDLNLMMNKLNDLQIRLLQKKHDSQPMKAVSAYADDKPTPLP